VVISVTPSIKPVYDAHFIKQGATICGVGAYQPQMEETPAELVAKADKIYFDSKDAVLAESGDIIIPLNKGLISNADFTGEIGQVVSGEVTGRENDNEIIFFETVGIAAQDLMAAKSIYDNAVKQNVGTQVNMKPNYDPYRTFAHTIEFALASSSDNVPMMVCHPGYLDQSIIQQSSLTIPRTQEVDFLCDPKVVQEIEDKGLHLARYTELS